MGYRSWFVDEGFAIYRNPDAKGETPIMQAREGYNSQHSIYHVI